MPTHMGEALAAQVRTTVRRHHHTLLNRRSPLAAPATGPDSSCLRYRRRLRRIAVGRAAAGLRMNGYPDMDFDFESAAGMDDDANDPDKMREDFLVLLGYPPSLFLVLGREAYVQTICTAAR